ncbi:MAG: hypothetical protein D6713_06435 [Deltaproteobacteria bacterium]|nr:MAG: hypothetical protein D6713_06435 [Deltaproteobacteria bacterium]
MRESGKVPGLPSLTKGERTVRRGKKTFATLILSLLLILSVSFSPLLRAAEVSGEAGAEYRASSGGDGFTSGTFSDQDLRGYGRIVLRNLYGGKVTGYLDLEYLKDLDGFEVSDPFSDTVDTYSSRDDLRVNEGYLDLVVGEGISVRAGRQRALAAEDAFFDGLKVTGGFGKVKGFLFGGLRASHYVEPDRDALFGGKISWTPLSGITLYLADTKYVKNSLEVGGNLRLLSLGTVSGSFGVIEEDPRFIRLTATSREFAGFVLSGDYTRKLGNGADYEDFDFDFTSPDGRSLERLHLGDLKPYAEYTLSASRGFEGIGFFRLGVTRHKLVHDEDEDEYNRTFNEFFVDYSGEDLFGTGISLNLSYRHVEEDRVFGDDASFGEFEVALARDLKEVTEGLSAGVGGYATSYTRLTSIGSFSSPVDETSKNYYAFLDYKRGRVRGTLTVEASQDDVTERYGAEWTKSVSVEVAYTFD